MNNTKITDSNAQAAHFDNDCNRHKKQRQEHQRPLVPWIRFDQETAI